MTNKDNLCSDASLTRDCPEPTLQEKEVLEEENATKQLRSSVAELSEEAEDSEGVGTSLKLLMSSTYHCNKNTCIHSRILNDFLNVLTP